ncbi:response regulator [Candidatus Sumerlaeota bacterium]|nr:response regulator [Candidatus Sumerlaeota bacterium]
MPCAKILVVDDEPGFLEFCRLTLNHKYDVVLLQSAEACEELIRREKIDLILLDIRLPGMDGLALAEKIKSDPDLSPIPIIIITGVVADSDLPPGFWKLGTPAQGFLTKPVDTATLLDEVEKVLAKTHGIDTSIKSSGGYL